MQPSPEKIFRLHYQLSAAQPIIGSCHLRSEYGKSQWDMHYGLEFGLVCSGKMRRLFPDKYAMDVKPGDVWFCGMWEPHGVKTITASCDVIVLKIWPPFLAQMYFPEATDFCALAPFNAPPRQRPRIPAKIKETMIEFGGQLKDILSSGAPHQAVRLRFALQEILLCVFEVWPSAALWSSRAPPIEFARINRALQLVFESRTFVSTAAAARVCGMNQRKFSALFRSWMNISFADFSFRYRLQEAAAQLRDDLAMPIKKITRQCGFVDESHFCRIFMKHFGVSPGEYRRR